MKYKLLCILLVACHFVSAQDSTRKAAVPIAGKDSAKAGIDTVSKKKTGTDSLSKKEAVDKGEVYGIEAIVIDDSTYQVVLTKYKDQHFMLSVYSSGDSVPVKSLLKMTSNTTYAVFRNILLELVRKKSGKPLVNKSEVELQVSQIYTTLFSKIKTEASPEVANLREQLATMEGLLDDKYKFAGTMKIKGDSIQTFRRSKSEVWRSDKQILNKRIRELRDLIKKIGIDIGKVEEAGSDEGKVSGETPQQAEARKDSNVKTYEGQIAKYSKQLDSLNAVKKQLRRYRYIATNGVFVADSVFIGFFNSSVDKLSVFGSYDSDTTDGDKTFHPIRYNDVVRTYNRSFGLRALNQKEYYFTVNEGLVNEYAIRLSDLLTYSKYQNSQSYIIKDQAITLRRDSMRSIPMQRRALYDYLSLITFIDFLGITSATTNNYIQIEGRARFPLMLSTVGYPRYLANLTLLPMFETYLNASFINDNNIGGRQGEIAMTPGKDTLFYDHFDLLRNYNIKAGLSLGLFSLQYKSIHSRIYGAIDLKMYRTTFSMTKVNSGLDSLVQTNVFALSYAPSVIIEYRPDFNIGADVRLSMDYSLSPLSSRTNELEFLPAKGPVFNGSTKYVPIRKKQKIIYGIEVNAYSFLTPNKEKNDGIFFRFAIYANRNLTNISPYIMAGYATSLKGLVKAGKNESKNKAPAGQ